MVNKIICNCCGVDLNPKNEGIYYFHKGCVPKTESTKEQLKGIIMRDLLKALFKSKEIADKECFIADFDELLEMI